MSAVESPRESSAAQKSVLKKFIRLIQDKSIVLHLSFLLYMIAGSAVFYYIENPIHASSTSKQISVSDTFCRVLTEKVNETATFNRLYLDEIATVCNELIGITENSSTANVDDSWEFSAALFFSMTVVTTIGYGSFAPVSDYGKVFTIIFGFFGIPLCGFLMASISSKWSSVLTRIYDKRRNRRNGVENLRTILKAAVVFLLPGLGVFLLVPSIIFSFIEGWTYLDALYFSFVTLTTVGFGDIVATWHTSRDWLWFYRISWTVWVYLGIAYWATIIYFITKAVESMKFRKAWKQIGEVIVEQFSNGNHNSSFIASAGKTVFDFALQMTESVGQMQTSSGSHLRTVLPGIATALKPTPGRGLMELMQLSISMLGNPNHPPTESREEPKNITEVQVEPVKPPTTMISIDSSSDIDADVKEVATKPQRRRPPENGIVKTDTALSLPVNLGAVARHPKASNVPRTKSLTRPNVRKPARKVESQSRQEVILQVSTLPHVAQADQR